MARNMKSANKRVFERLAGYVDSETLEASKSVKFIISTTEEKDWLKSVSFIRNEDLFIDRQRGFALATYSGARYILQIGFGPAHGLDEDLTLIPNNSGIFVALASEFDLPIIERNDLKWELKNEVFLPSDQAEMTGFDFLNIEKFFQSYHIYKLAPASTLSDEDLVLTLQKSALYMLGHSPEAVYLKTTARTLESLRTLARLDVRALPFDRVFRAFIERRYEHAFLDLYRCLEMLYSLKKIDELKSNLNSDLKHFELSAVIESTLGWRPIEKSALIEIVNQFPKESIEQLKQSFKGDAEICTNIYNLRNECVHFRPLQKLSNLAKDVDWVRLLESMALAIYQAYHVSYRRMF